jgi:PAS domain S-box-containing protein
MGDHSRRAREPADEIRTLHHRIAKLERLHRDHARVVEALRNESAHVRLLQTVAVAANEAATIEDALRTALKAVCAHAGWPAAHAYLVAEDGTRELVPTSIWYATDPERFEPLREATERTRLAPGVGMPGRVLSTAKPLWISGVAGDPSYPRAQLGRALGLGAGFGFPVLAGSEVVGVLEFFSEESEPPGERMLNVMALIGTQMGRVIERKRAEEALRRSQKRLWQIIDLVPHMIFAKDSRGCFLLANRAVAEAYGTSVEELVGRGHRAMHASADEVSRMLADDAAVLESGEPKHVPCEKFTDSAGRVRLLQTVKIPFTESASNEPAILGVATDITERTRAEEERRRLEERMLQAQKFESLGVLAGGIAHDFNNLLTGILSNAATARREFEPGDLVLRNLDEIVQGAKIAAHLTQQLLAYSGRGQLDVRPLDLSREVRAIEGLLKASVERRARLVMELSEDLPAIEADAAQVQQVLMNLVINAAESTDSHGYVRIRTRAIELDERDLLKHVPGSRAEPGLHVELSVEDDGRGMDPDTLARIFDPFFSTKPAGHGLGLAATIGIVHRHGGGLSVDSAPGRGTVFRICFAASAQRVEAVRDASEEDLQGEGVVLVVDDDDYVLRAACVALEGFGYTAIPARGGRRAIELFHERGHEIDLVVLDLAMPGMSGEETLRALRALRPDVAILVSSAYAAREVATDSASRDVAGFVQKPYEPQQLASEVKRILGGGRDRPSRAVDQELLALRASYRQSLPAKLDELEALLREARACGAAGEPLVAARERAHQLKGTSGSYGLDAVAASLERIEDALERLPDGAGSEAEELWAEVDAQLHRARDSVV